MVLNDLESRPSPDETDHAALGAERIDGEVQPGPDGGRDLLRARGLGPQVEAVPDVRLGLA